MIKPSECGNHILAAFCGVLCVLPCFGFLLITVKSGATPEIKHPCEPTQIRGTVCTVDLLTPNFFAAERTVARFSMMYRASSMTRSSMLVLNITTPENTDWLNYMFDRARLDQMRAWAAITAGPDGKDAIPAKDEIHRRYKNVLSEIMSKMSKIMSKIMVLCFDKMRKV